jgi:hypothetical protein
MRVFLFKDFPLNLFNKQKSLIFYNDILIFIDLLIFFRLIFKKIFLKIFLKIQILLSINKLTIIKKQQESSLVEF